MKTIALALISVFLALPAWALTIPFQVDKTGFTEGTTGELIIGGCVNDTRGGTIAEDNVGCLRLTGKGDLHVTQFDGAGVQAISNASSLSAGMSNPTVSGIATYLMAQDPGASTWSPVKSSPADNSAFTASTTPVGLFGGCVSGSSVTSGNFGCLQMSTDRTLYMNIAKVGNTSYALGQGTKSASMSVVMSSDYGNYPIGVTNSTGTNQAPIYCDTQVKFNTASSGNTLLQALASTKVIYVCDWDIYTSSASATNVSLTYGTQTTNPCDTGTVTLSSIIRFPASVTGLQGKLGTNSAYRGMKTAASNQLCVNNSAAVQIDGSAYIAQF